jgi:hypothetical protein
LFISSFMCVKSVSVLILDLIVLLLISFVLLSYHGTLLFEVILVILQHLLSLLFVLFVF